MGIWGMVDLDKGAFLELSLGSCNLNVCAQCGWVTQDNLPSNQNSLSPPTTMLGLHPPGKLLFIFQNLTYGSFSVCLSTSIKSVLKAASTTYSCSYHDIYQLYFNVFVYMGVFFQRSYFMNGALESPLSQVASLVSSTR